MRTFSLTSDSAADLNWTLSPAGPLPAEWTDRIPATTSATVPGEVHTDLLAAGLIPEPFDGDNESLLQWIGRTDWSYRLTFDWQPGAERRHDLVADGLDTFATIVLNGTEVGRTANQHRGYRFDVTSLLREGSNELVINFAAPSVVAEQAEEQLGARPVSYTHPYNAVRKMASSFGWDWGPDLAGAGIWKPIRIESWDTVRLATVRPLAGVGEGSTGLLTAEVDLDWLTGSGNPVTVAVEIAGQTVERSVEPGTPHVTIEAEIADAQLWWPRGYGDQPLYPTTVRLRAGDHDLDRWDGRVGFRNITLSTKPDRQGTEFVLSVNDQPIYIKGYNWIPDDAFLTRLNSDSYRTSIMEAYDSGANLLRIWGGGIYESSYFYTVCDELGILVWQDFLFACAAYSEDEPLWSEVEAEAREAITRLSSHASLAVWNGNNENIWGYADWGWRPHLAGRSWGNGYYRDLLPQLVAELDPRTPYSPGSPFSYDDYLHPNDARHGSMHIWDVWNSVDYTTYRSHRPRYVSEFGFQGPPAWSTLTSVVHDQPLDPYGRQMLVHQKAGDGNLKLERGLGDHLPKWRTEPEIAIDDWHWLTQLNQARALRFGIEHFRSLAPLNTGTCVWQLNDNWPVISWAAVDYAGIRKPLWYALKAAYADRLLTVQPRDDDHGKSPTLIAHNDTAESWSATLVISRRSTTVDSTALAEQRIELNVGPRSSATIALADELITPSDPAAEYVQVRSESGDAPAYWYFVEDPQLQLTAPAIAYTASVERVDGGFRVTVAAQALVKDLALFPDRLDPAARVDSCLITLQAGESHTFTVTGAEGVDPQQLITAPVLRSVNDVITATVSA
ncbi:glycoside hydrolase family 2 protein [Microlunatus elymi]|uniref:beta-mannosidase n=1 Tax=Microlunatus elymi TaxID=2596828 RepID=A0A516PXP3_9ACTN|nr:glycoside hydrolase family 2 protein [Microlunatus elymi]QDP95731.1 glycoside hydrolase family 2 protein [Microlunatus elymi]